MGNPTRFRTRTLSGKCSYAGQCACGLSDGEADMIPLPRPLSGGRRKRRLSPWLWLALVVAGLVVGLNVQGDLPRKALHHIPDAGKMVGADHVPEVGNMIELDLANEDWRLLED